ncbi:MAG: hypothetical protein KKA73_03415 [Chloroflexi bacterium]|nr:hypothetical protein [Chloroflexota bacterium]MBU1746713.1 hypothetical protein [Chloroflexota bacterium]
MAAPVRVQRSDLRQQLEMASRLSAGLDATEYEVFAGLLRLLEALLAGGSCVHVVFVKEDEAMTQPRATV